MNQSEVDIKARAIAEAEGKTALRARWEPDGLQGACLVIIFTDGTKKRYYQDYFDEQIAEDPIPERVHVPTPIREGVADLPTPRRKTAPKRK